MTINPLAIDTHDLPRQAGSYRDETLTVPAPAGWSGELIGVPEGASVPLRLRLEAVGEGVLVTGQATVPLAGECARCLTQFTTATERDFVQLYYYDDREADEDALFLVDERADLGEVLRDAIVLDLPFTPLCRQNCAGLCPQCGANLTDEPDHSHVEATDSRWEKLADWPGRD